MEKLKRKQCFFSLAILEVSFRFCHQINNNYNMTKNWFGNKNFKKLIKIFFFSGVKTKQHHVPKAEPLGFGFCPFGLYSLVRQGRGRDR
jgi:hypothetical protein